MNKPKAKKKRITFHFITLFPSMFDSYLNESIVKRAIERKLISVKFYNPRDFSKDKFARVDRRPYGGGPGMVIEPACVLRALDKAIGKKDRKKVKVCYFEPHGTLFDTAIAEKFKNSYEHIVCISGRYEGIDARVKKISKAQGISIGPYTLTGGELPGMVLLDAITRRIEGVLGHDESVEERRVASSEVYTRPEVLEWKGKKHRVPKVLLSGNHKEIEAWKKKTLYKDK